MRRARLVVAVAVAAAVLMVGLSGCSDDPEPRVERGEPRAPTADSTRAVDAPVEPTMPVQAQGEDAAAAEAFVSYFWAMVNHAEQTGETNGLAALALDTCDACRGGSESIREIHESGGTVRGGTVAVISG